jgi:hypothetical protein
MIIDNETFFRHQKNQGLGSPHDEHFDFEGWRLAYRVHLKTCAFCQEHRRHMKEAKKAA